MSSIRDLLNALRGRGGVDAAIVVGQDGLVVDGDTADGVDRERVAAHLPAMLAAGDALGGSADRGRLVMAVLEHERGGLAVLSVLSAEVFLLVLLDASADVGPLLYELRHERSRIAALV